MSFFEKIERFFVEKAERDFWDNSTVENGVLVKYEGTGSRVVIPEGITEIKDYAKRTSARIRTGRACLAPFLRDLRKAGVR